MDMDMDMDNGLGDSATCSRARSIIPELPGTPLNMGQIWIEIRRRLFQLLVRAEAYRVSVFAFRLEG